MTKEQIEKLLQEIYQKVYKTSKTQKGLRIVQSEQNQLKAEVENILKSTIENEYPDLITYNSVKGVILEVPNENEGAIYFELQVISKPLDYDVISENEAYQDKMEKLAERKAKKEKERKV